MNRIVANTAMFLAAASTALAHGTGSHTKVMGTVSSMTERQVVVRTTDGNERTILLEEDTACMDRRGDASCSGIKPGNRVVVVTRPGKDGQVFADEIKFSRGGDKASAEEPAAGHRHHSGVEKNAE